LAKFNVTLHRFCGQRPIRSTKMQGNPDIRAIRNAAQWCMGKYRH